MDLAGKVALVTGGGRGIGLATARALRARGAHVVLVDLRREEVDAAAEALGGLGLVADVTDRAAMQRAVAATVERFGGLDVVVANAGIAHRPATARVLGTETFDRVLDVNLHGVWRTVEAALPQVVARGGHVVVVASVYAFINGLGQASYAMSKAGVEALGRTLRVELAGHGVGVTTAYFGFIDTDMVQQALDRDPLKGDLEGALPGLLHKRLAPQVAGEAIVLGIERGAPRVVRPRRWAVLSVLRGVLNPLLDAHMARDARVQGIARELDERAGQDTPTTA